MLRLYRIFIFINIFYFSLFSNNKTLVDILKKNDTVINIDGHNIYIKYTPNKVKGTFLMLHGWNLPPLDWCNKTTICQKAIAKGYNVVLPDMGKSIYHYQIYKETRKDWHKSPTRVWLVKKIFPLLQSKNLLLATQNNFIVGLSTGARGVALICIDCPKLFRGAAALSGDYQQGEIPHDNLCIGYYGPYSKFKQRWLNVDNVIRYIDKFKTPIYLGHGIYDKVCTAYQTKLFYKELKKTNAKLKVKLNLPKASHDYKYWASEVDNILEFFDEILSVKKN